MSDVDLSSILSFISKDDSKDKHSIERSSSQLKSDLSLNNNNKLKNNNLTHQPSKHLSTPVEQDNNDKSNSGSSNKSVDGINISSVLSLSPSVDKDSEILESFPSLEKIIASTHDINIPNRSEDLSQINCAPSKKKGNQKNTTEEKTKLDSTDDNFSNILSSNIPDSVINPITSSFSSKSSNEQKNDNYEKDDLNDIISATFSQHSLLLQSQANNHESEDVGSDSDRLSDIISNFSYNKQSPGHNNSGKQSNSDNPSDVISVSEKKPLNKLESKSNSNKITDAYSDIISGSISNVSNNNNASEKEELHQKPSSLDSAGDLMSGIMSSDIDASSSHSLKKNNNTKRSNNNSINLKNYPKEKAEMKTSSAEGSSDGMSGIMSSSSSKSQKSTKDAESKKKLHSKISDNPSDILSFSSIASPSNKSKSSNNENLPNAACDNLKQKSNSHIKSSHSSKSSKSSKSSSASINSGILSSNSHKSTQKSKSSAKDVLDSSGYSKSSHSGIEFSTTEEKVGKKQNDVNPTIEIERTGLDRQNTESSLIDSRRLSIGSISSLSTIDKYEFPENESSDFTKEEKSSIDFLDQIISDIDSEKSELEKLTAEKTKKDNTSNQNKTNKISEKKKGENNELRKQNNSNSTNSAKLTNSGEIMPGVFFGGNSHNSNDKSKIQSNKKDSSSSIAIEYESGSNSFSADKKPNKHSDHSSAQNVKSFDSSIYVEYESYSSNKSKHRNNELPTNKKNNSNRNDNSSSISGFISEVNSNTKSNITNTSSTIVVDFESGSSSHNSSSRSNPSKSHSIADTSSNIVIDYDSNNSYKSKINDFESSLNIETFESQTDEDFKSSAHGAVESSIVSEIASKSSESPQHINSLDQIESDFEIDVDDNSKSSNSKSNAASKESAAIIESFSSSKSNLFEDDFEYDASKTKHDTQATTGIDEDDFVDSNEIIVDVKKVETESDNIISSVQSFHSSSSIKRRRKKKKTPEDILKIERPYAMTLHGKHETKIQYTQQNKINFSLPPAKKGKATVECRKPIVLFEPPVLSSATLTDVNSCYRESLRSTQKKVRYINQSLSSMLLSRRERDIDIKGNVITLDGVYQEINKRNIERKEIRSQDLNLEHYSSAAEL